LLIMATRGLDFMGRAHIEGAHESKEPTWRNDMI
jgi:hypothetical protein